MPLVSASLTTSAAMEVTTVIAKDTVAYFTSERGQLGFQRLLRIIVAQPPLLIPPPLYHSYEIQAGWNCRFADEAFHPSKSRSRCEWLAGPVTYQQVYMFQSEQLIVQKRTINPLWDRTAFYYIPYILTLPYVYVQPASETLFSPFDTLVICPNVWTPVYDASQFPL